MCLVFNDMYMSVLKNGVKDDLYGIWEGLFHVWKYFCLCFLHLAMMIFMRCEGYVSIVNVPK